MQDEREDLYAVDFQDIEECEDAGTVDRAPRGKHLIANGSTDSPTHRVISLPEIPVSDERADKGAAIPPKKRRSGLIWGIVIGVLLLLLAAIVAFAYSYYHHKIALLQYDDGTNVVYGTIDENDEEVLHQAAEMDEATKGLEETAPIFAAPVGDKDYTGPFDGNIVNILLLGTDERSATFTDAARSDTTILCSVNLDTGEIKLVSLERGMGVPVLAGEHEGEWDWLTHIFRYGGADLMMKTVSYCFDIDVHYYVRVNFNTFIQLVDALGGIDITLSEAEANYLNESLIAYNEDLSGYVTPGVNHLNGWCALQYARTRKIDSDWVRVVRQRVVIQQIMQKAQTLNVAQLDNVLNTVLPLIKTNMTEEEITSLLLKVPLILDTMSVEGVTLPVKGTYGSMTGMGGRSLFAVDFAANSAILHEMIYGTKE